MQELYLITWQQGEFALLIFVPEELDNMQAKLKQSLAQKKIIYWNLYSS